MWGKPKVLGDSDATPLGKNVFHHLPKLMPSGCSPSVRSPGRHFLICPGGALPPCAPSLLWPHPSASAFFVFVCTTPWEETRLLAILASQAGLGPGTRKPLHTKNLYFFVKGVINNREQRSCLGLMVLNFHCLLESPGSFKKILMARTADSATAE